MFEFKLVLKIRNTLTYFFLSKIVKIKHAKGLEKSNGFRCDFFTEIKKIFFKNY